MLGWFSGKTSLYLCSTLFNTQRLRELGGFNSRHNLFQDAGAELLLAARFGRVDIEPVKASFRKHSGEMTYKVVRVREWCEDSLELLNTICEFAHDRKALIREEGLRFFSKLNYQRASCIHSHVHRFLVYLMVFRLFDYHYSPVGFVMSTDPLFIEIRRVLSKARSMIGSSPWRTSE